jgi:hypothetical protein
MNWDSLIISSKPSTLVKDTLTLNQSQYQSQLKHIGIIPIHWDTLEIYKKNKKERQDDQEMDTNLDTEIQTINTSKNKLLMVRNFYYKTQKSKKEGNENKDKLKKNKKENNMKETDNNGYFPVYKFPEDLPFSLREIKNKIIEWLSYEGFNLDDDDKDEINIYRIYKMTGFHLFLVLLNKKILSSNSAWMIDSGIEILNIEDKEIVNPFMKVSQSKFNNKKNYSNNSDSNYIWNRKIIGDIIPYEIKWEELIATFANLIDTNANKNLNLYFMPNIIDNNNYNYNVISNLSKSMSEPASDI